MREFYSPDSDFIGEVPRAVDRSPPHAETRKIMRASPQRKIAAAALSFLLISNNTPNPGGKSIKEGSVIETEENEAYEKLLRLLEEETEEIEMRKEPMKKQLDLSWFPKGIMRYKDVFEEVGSMRDIDPNVLGVMAWLETRGGGLNVTSSAGAQGFMQIMPATAQAATERYGVSSFDPWDDRESIEMAGRIVEMNQQWLGESLPSVSATTLKQPEVIMAAYNGGPGAAEDFIRNGFDKSVLPNETQHYIEKGLLYLNGDTPKELLP